MARRSSRLVVTGAAPRAVGVRIGYDAAPAHVRAWVDDQLGSPVVTALEQAGGMSPGCATRVLTASGRRAFVKAVGPELNPRTPDLFRHEARVLTDLGADPLWAGLLAAYDEPGGWVALLLEDVEGRHPDLSNADDTHAVVEAVDALATRLEGRGTGLDIGTLQASLSRYAQMWPALGTLDEDLFPRWAVDAADDVRRRVPALVAAAYGDHLVNYDIRNDNMLVRDDGSVVFVDWGMSRVGAGWLDPLLLRLEWAEHPVFDGLVTRSPALAELGDDEVTTFLFTLGAWLAYRVTVADDTGLPALDAFRRQESARFLTGARRRLGIG